MEQRDVKTWEDVLRRLSAIAIRRHPRQGGEPNVDRMRAFMDRLGNPQNQLRVIHVAGTSGKGSTATSIAHLLHALGWSVGLHVSPHLTDLRERMTINGAIVSTETLLPIFREIFDVVDIVTPTPVGEPSFFEILVAASYLLFARQYVDYAVIEVGMGGRWDSTNVIDREDKIAVITRLGLDHTKVLGNTLPKIASEKSGIIRNRNHVFSAWQRLSARKVIETEASKCETQLFYIRSGSKFRNIQVHLSGTSFIFGGTDENEKLHMRMGLIGRHQAENASLAISVVQEVCRREARYFDESLIQRTLEDLVIPGRFEVRKIQDRRVVFDVAHNPQKFKSLIQTLKNVWPKQKPIFVVAGGEHTEYSKMLHLLAKVAAGIVLTDFEVTDAEYAFRFADPHKLEACLRKEGFRSWKTVRDDPKASVQTAGSFGPGPIVVTGYFHFVAAMRRVLGLDGR